MTDWSTFLTPRARAGKSSPIDAFYESQRVLVRAAAAIDAARMDDDVSELIAGQLFLGYVSATELYLRQTFATVVQICPVVRRLNSEHLIAFSAIDYYDRRDLELALTEQVSFTEVGKIRALLKARLGIDVQGKTSLERAVSDFENVCQLRHALVHSHGRMSSRNAGLFLATSGGRDSKARFDTRSLDDAAAVSVNLVREVNLEIMKHVVWQWIAVGELSTDRRVTRARLSKLVKAIGSQWDASQKLVTIDEGAITDTVMGVIRTRT